MKSYKYRKDDLYFFEKYFILLQYDIYWNYANWHEQVERNRWKIWRKHMLEKLKYQSWSISAFYTYSTIINTSHLTQPYSTFLHLTQPYATLLNLTQPYSTLLNLTQPYVTLLNLTRPYSTLRNLNQPYSTLFNLTQPYSTLFNLTQTYSTLRNLE